MLRRVIKIAKPNDVNVNFNSADYVVTKYKRIGIVQRAYTGQFFLFLSEDEDDHSGKHTLGRICVTFLSSSRLYTGLSGLRLQSDGLRWILQCRGIRFLHLVNVEV